MNVPWNKDAYQYSYELECRIERLVKERAALRTALDAADAYFAFHNAYRSTPASQFLEQHPDYKPDSASQVLTELMAAYSTARAALGEG